MVLYVSYYLSLMTRSEHINLYTDNVRSWRSKSMNFP